MNRVVTLFATLLLISGCASLPQTPPPGMPASVAAPETTVGASWTYHWSDGYTGLPRGDYRYTVVGVEPQTLVVDVSRDNKPLGKEFFTPDWNWREKPMPNLQNFRYDPPYPALPFPLAAGKTWHAYVHAMDPVTGRVNRVRIDGDVLGWERVTVPAGTFDALKVRRQVYAGNFDFFHNEDHILEFAWYSPQLGHVVKYESSSYYLDNSRSCRSAECMTIKKDWNVLELVSYQRGGRGS